MSHHNPDPNKKIHLTIDGCEVTVPEGTRILEAAREVGIKIPTLCEHPELRKRAVCRLCVVECDGRGKLLAACASDVWEGMNVVTNNPRILSIRKMIIELLLADHPPQCLDCIRNTNCELQTLAKDFGIREPYLHHETEHKPAAAESNTLVRDMSKCIKCGRCVEACQELQTIRNINSAHRSVLYEISTPYGQSLDDGPCVFCGQCAQLCPVGAIYEHEQISDAWALLSDPEIHAAVQIDPALCGAFDELCGLPGGTVTPPKIATALKHLGFSQVFDARVFNSEAAQAKNRELAARMKSPKPQLPLISGCSQGWIKFAETFYPDLKDHFFTGKDPRQTFGAKIAEQRADIIRAGCVSIEPCIARKFSMRKFAARTPEHDLVLTTGELAQMFKQSGINFGNLPETAFSGGPKTEPAQTPVFTELQDGILETEITIDGTKAKMIVVYGFANARTVLDSIRKGECGAALVHIMSCPKDNKLCSIPAC